MRREMKQKVHAGCTGINSCLRRAREFIYWPGISAEIRQYVESCDTCSSYSIMQSKEPLFMHEVPSRPWEKIGTDIFTLNGRHYLITVDYYSQFFEIDYLTETSSEALITKLKHHFARHGIPDIVISDNVRGTDLLDAAFKLAKHMGIEFSGSTGWVWRFRKCHGISNKKVQGELGVPIKRR